MVPGVLFGFLGARSFFTIGVDRRCGGASGGTLGVGGATGFGGMDALPGLTSLGCPDAAGGGGA
jgi:hypothetical protein